ncbi:MAG TPA: hypothetical protein VF713_08400, partial [Thermoanaerobaculia bacterium]
FPIAFSGSRLTLVADVFNVFNRQAITKLDNRMDLSSDSGCAVFDKAGFTGAQKCVLGGTDANGNPIGVGNGFGGWANISGTTKPIGSFADARAAATNPDFLKKGLTFTGVRSIRLGVRWSF